MAWPARALIAGTTASMSCSTGTNRGSSWATDAALGRTAMSNVRALVATVVSSVVVLPAKARRWPSRGIRRSTGRGSPL